MHIRELLHSATIMDEPSDNCVILVSPKISNWAEKYMCIERSLFDNVYIKYKAHEPDVEPILAPLVREGNISYKRKFAESPSVKQTYYKLMGDNVQEEQPTEIVEPTEVIEEQPTEVTEPIEKPIAEDVTAEPEPIEEAVEVIEPVEDPIEEQTTVEEEPTVSVETAEDECVFTPDADDECTFVPEPDNAPIIEPSSSESDDDFFVPGEEPVTTLNPINVFDVPVEEQDDDSFFIPDSIANTEPRVPYAEATNNDGEDSIVEEPEVAEQMVEQEAEEDNFFKPFANQSTPVIPLDFDPELIPEDEGDMDFEPHTFNAPTQVDMSESRVFDAPVDEELNNLDIPDFDSLNIATYLEAPQSEPSETEDVIFTPDPDEQDTEPTGDNVSNDSEESGESDDTSVPVDTEEPDDTNVSDDAEESDDADEVSEDITTNETDVSEYAEVDTSDGFEDSYIPDDSVNEDTHSESDNSDVVFEDFSAIREREYKTYMDCIRYNEPLPNEILAEAKEPLEQFPKMYRDYHEIFNTISLPNLFAFVGTSSDELYDKLKSLVPADSHVSLYFSAPNTESDFFALMREANVEYIHACYYKDYTRANSICDLFADIIYTK